MSIKSLQGRRHQTMSVPRTVCETFSVKNGVTLKPSYGSFKVIENDRPYTSTSTVLTRPSNTKSYSTTLYCLVL